MATYTPDDLAGFEFKFLRSASGRFKNPEFLRSSLEVEETAGWTLVEKFDNQRIRLKRPLAARRGDAALSFDPYRTVVGLSEGQLGLMIGGIVLAVIAIVAIVLFLTLGR